MEPRYEEKRFPDDDKRGRLRLIASPNGKEGSLRINQDVRVYGSILNNGESIGNSIGGVRYTWIQVVDGFIDADGLNLGRGHGAAIYQETSLRINGRGEFHLFDLA